ncbi:MAG: single-stranded-DNA-specific exonuclease RecJ [Bdellovibrionaceae bacterium]|nr:single-stranded-DNA-specific exonuclease RecJ [Pseudobdellovibrionaceae bacterium]
MSGFFMTSTGGSFISTSQKNPHSLDRWKEVPASVQNFLQLRGFSNYAEALEFLNFSLKDIADPLRLLGMERSVERLATAYKNDEAICVYGDFDMDGTPAVALLVRGLKELGFKKVFGQQADRHKDGYGFHVHLADKMIQDHSVGLFITVDVGITDVQAVRELQNRGVDVIVTDHHQEKEELPPAYAVINPNQKNCTSGLNHLCGTGVAFYVMIALNRYFRDNKLSPNGIEIKNLLDCFAIATIADLVPLKKENRILVKHGLKVLEKTNMHGIRALMTALQMNNKALNPNDVGIRLVPKLNSLTRMGGDLMPLDLFLVDNPEEALSYATKALDVNDLRVQSLKKAEKELEEHVAKAAIANPKDTSFFWSYSSTFHKGLVGLLAARVVNNTQKTAFVGALMADGETIVGSARTADVGGHNVFAALTSCESVLNKFGGHPQAAGFEVSLKNVDRFSALLRDYFLAQPQEDVSEQNSNFDMIVSIRDAKEFLTWIDKLEPFGVGFAAPVFCFENMMLTEVKPLKGGEHFRLLLRDETGDSLSAVVFSYKGAPIMERGVYTLTGEVQWNEFRGNRTPQMLVQNLQFVGEPEVFHTGVTSSSS